MKQKASITETKAAGESFAKGLPDPLESECTLSVEELAGITGGAISVEARGGKKGK